MAAPKLIIDMHTHLFNANYVPLEEIFISRGIPKILSKKLARMVHALTKNSKLRNKFSPEISNKISFESFLNSNVEMHKLHSNDDVYIDAFEVTIEDMVISQLYLEVDGLVDPFEVKSVVKNSELYKLLLELDLEFGDADSAAVLDFNDENGLQPESLIKSPFLGIVNKGVFRGLRKMLKRFIKKISRFVENTGDLLDFALTMMNGENTLLNRLSKYYSDNSNDFLLVHYMMDMKYPFSGNVKFDFYKEQLPQMTDLEKYSNGSLLGFSAFDPIRCLENALSDNEIISLIEISLKKEGKVGFKFYPPMGYRAANNEDEPKLEHIVDVFFDYCAANNVPIFTHCTPEGFEQRPGITGTNSHPKYWENCLQKSGRKNLKLCFGHAGGGKRVINKKTVYGWLSGIADEGNWNDEDNYAKWVVRLCRQYKNVYCEIAYMHEIMGDSGNSNKFRERLIVEYGRDVNEEFPYPLKDKIMYGSDWHMPSMVNDIDDYIKDILEIFTNDQLAEYKSQFFAGNAIKYLDLYRHLDRVENIFGESYVKSVKDKISVLNV